MGNFDTLPAFSKDIKKIAVLRANALGDLIFALPALQGLKDAFPQAKIVYLGKSWHKDFFDERPCPFDKVVVIPKYRGVPDEADTIEDEEMVNMFFQEMQNENFDLAFQMHGGGQNSNPFVKRLGAKLSVGFKTPNAIPLDLNVSYQVFHNEILRYIELVNTIGVTVKTLEPVLNTINSDFLELEKVVIPGQSLYVVIHPGASEIRRRWDAKKFGKVARYLAEKGFQVFFTGNEKEVAICDEAVRASKGCGVSLAGKLNLKALTALLANAEIVISNDTGPLHVSRALGTKTIGIFVGVNMIMASPVTATKHRTCISWTTNCPHCGLNIKQEDFNKPKGNCNHLFSFLDDVSVEEVTEQVEEILSFTPKCI